MKKIIFFFLVLIISTFVQIFAQNEQLDLNQASFNEIKSLPITEKQAEDIYLYRTYIKYFDSVYDLRKIKSIDQITFNKI
ncbi:MAG: helix-hairpin-helix domain-containing protein, partial [Candidatus Cloacimonetes bacterium]|nr:helix-hairpin-helix domain-containing protein [Candidatus Cloacimonadota bacterium]